MGDQVRVSLHNIQVIEGQGVGEGDFEMRIQVQEGNNSIVWPSANGYTKVDNNGVAHTINRLVGTYTVSNGSLTKRFEFDGTEVDGGTLGKDDQGQGSITFTLTPNMAPEVKYVTMSLKRPRMKTNGKVKVGLLAEGI
ncbi:MAG: hypothetical protein MUF01_07760 [Bryobacterales bacterium]|jgi:hypothetical protein|nr:hypothetical protein [Bryobacterales bacterium]